MNYINGGHYHIDFSNNVVSANIWMFIVLVIVIVLYSSKEAAISV